MSVLFLKHRELSPSHFLEFNYLTRHGQNSSTLCQTLMMVYTLSEFWPIYFQMPSCQVLPICGLELSSTMGHKIFCVFITSFCQTGASFHQFKLNVKHSTCSFPKSKLGFFANPVTWMSHVLRYVMHHLKTKYRNSII